MKTTQRFARTAMATALLAATFALPAHAGLLGGSGGLGGGLTGGLSPRGLDVAGSGNANAQGDLKARRATEAAKDKAVDGGQAAKDKATDGAQAATDRAKAGGDAATQRTQDGRAALTDRLRDTAGRTESGIGAGGNASAQASRRPAEAAPTTAAPTTTTPATATPSTAGGSTTPAPAAAPSRKVDAGADGSLKASRSERSVNAEGSGGASVQR